MNRALLKYGWIWFLFLPALVMGQAQELLSLRLVVPISTPDGQREISLEKYQSLHVIITNHSDVPQKLWKDWNTWGYFNLKLVWKLSNKTFSISRKAPQSWDGDFPDFWVLPPGESLVIEIDMASGEWDGFPDLYGEKYHATLQAFYENKADVLASEFGIWVGKIASQELEVVFQ